MTLKDTGWPCEWAEVGRELHPSAREEIGETLAFALRYNGRKRVQTAEDAMARITAERLVDHLSRSGFVVMKRADQIAPSTSQHRHPNADFE